MTESKSPKKVSLSLWYHSQQFKKVSQKFKKSPH